MHVISLKFSRASKHFLNMNTRLADSFQLASGSVLYQYMYTGHNFAHACHNSGTSVITYILRWLYHFECAVFTPLPHEEVKRNLDDVPESITMSNFSYLRLNPRQGQEVFYSSRFQSKMCEL